MDKFLYLDVPFSKKDYAKSIGCKWDSAVKKWYAPNEFVKTFWNKTKNDKVLSKT